MILRITTQNRPCLTKLVQFCRMLWILAARRSEPIETPSESPALQWVAYESLRLVLVAVLRPAKGHPATLLFLAVCILRPS